MIPLQAGCRFHPKLTYKNTHMPLAGMSIYVSSRNHVSGSICADVQNTSVDDDDYYAASSLPDDAKMQIQVNSHHHSRAKRKFVYAVPGTSAPWFHDTSTRLSLLAQDSSNCARSHMYQVVQGIVDHGWRDHKDGTDHDLYADYPRGDATASGISSSKEMVISVLTCKRFSFHFLSTVLAGGIFASQTSRFRRHLFTADACIIHPDVRSLLRRASIQVVLEVCLLHRLDPDPDQATSGV